VRIFPTSLT